jgi:hypothetical protein
VSAKTYEIVVRGTFDPSLVEAIDGFCVDRTGHGLTYLIGSVPDQAGLLNVLQALRDLTIPLISVNPISPDRAASSDEAALPDGDDTEGHPIG